MKVVLVDFHIEMWQLGLSNAVKHNGVAQVFAMSNVSDNLNAICQDLLSQCASKHDLTLLLHEKPFANLSLFSVLTLPRR